MRAFDKRFRTRRPDSIGESAHERELRRRFREGGGARARPVAVSDGKTPSDGPVRGRFPRALPAVPPRPGIMGGGRMPGRAGKAPGGVFPSKTAAGPGSSRGRRSGGRMPDRTRREPGPPEKSARAGVVRQRGSPNICSRRMIPGVSPVLAIAPPCGRPPRIPPPIEMAKNRRNRTFAPRIGRGWAFLAGRVLSRSGIMGDGASLCVLGPTRNIRIR